MAPNVFVPISLFEKWKRDFIHAELLLIQTPVDCQITARSVAIYKCYRETLKICVEFTGHQMSIHNGRKGDEKGLGSPAT